jgi:predicted porin
MKKALLPLMIASLLPAAAFADVTVYGKANVAWQSSDKNVGGNYTELVNNASRIGLKGSEVINDDLKVIYQFEYETKVDDGSAGGQTFSQRNIYVGLQGTGGTVMAGMFDTPLKLAQEKVDLFNDLVGDLKNVLEGDVRAKNVVQYSSPAFSNITANVAYVNNEQDAKNASNGYSASIVYNTKPIYLALAMDQNSKLATDTKTAADDTEILRAVGRFTFGSVVLGAMWENYDNGTIDEDGFLLSGQWNLTDKWALKLQHQASDMIQRDGKSTSFGVDYKLNKAAKLFGYYTTLEDERPVSATNSAVDNIKRADDKYVAIGLELNF